MSHLRSILDDLRAKRLWPVAVALVAAIAAVPLLLSSNAAPPTVARTPVGGGTAPRASALPAVSVVATSAHARITGRARDPFSLQSPPHVAAATGVSSGPAPATGPVPSAGGARTSDPGGSGTSTGNSATSTTTTTTQPGQVRYFFYTTDVSFGKTAGPARAYRNVPRLTPLPSAANPVLVFLGVNQGAKAAVFMVSSLASLSGDGTCLPNRAQCFFLRLAPGQRESVAAPDVQGIPSSYSVKVAAIHVRSTASLAQAKSARARTSPAGNQIVAGARKHLPLLWALSYSVSTGLLSMPAGWDAALAHVAK